MRHPLVRLWRFLPRGGAVLFLFCLLPQLAFADVDTKDGDRGKKKRGGNVALQQALDVEFMNVNNVLFAFENNGILGADERLANQSFGLFPANAPRNNYIFGTGIWIGGIVNGVKVVSTGYDASGGFSEMNPGRAAVNGGGAEQILCIPDNTPEETAFSTANWYPEFARDSAGAPVLFGQKDCVIIYNDSNQSRSVSDPIGLEIRQRTMAFTLGLLTQAIFVVWDIANVGGNTLTDAFIGLNGDFDIGDDAGDDRCSAIPIVPPGANNETNDTLETNLGFCWDANFNEATFDPNPPGFVGVTFFQGPKADDGSTLGLTRFTLTTNPTSNRPQPDPNTDEQQYDLMAGLGTRAPFVDATAADVRFVEISGPFTFEPGEVQQVAVGYLFGNAPAGTTDLDVSPTRCFPAPLNTPCFLPDPQDPKLGELIAVQRSAQIVFNAGFRFPGPPPKPDLALIPGDRQVTIVFSDVSGVPDPFFPIASDPTSIAFDPNFRQFDFEGFIIVRSTSGDPNDVDTIAIFDIANDIVIIDDTTFGTFTIGDTTVTLPTSTVRVLNLPNTGLQFSFVDQGLINGIVYFYDVLPFDVNSALLTGLPSLSPSIAFQPRDIKSVRPRSDASSFARADLVFEALSADGTVCDTSEPAYTLDPATGHYTDFLGCSNAIFDLDAQAFRDLALPAGEFFFVIDSILPGPSNPYSPTAGYALAAGGNRVWFHWEDASGALANAFVPAVGFFDQGFTFGGAFTNALPIGFGFDPDPNAVGPEASLGLFIASDFSAFEDLEVNGQSVHLQELGGSHPPIGTTGDGESRPHLVENSSLADTVILGNARGIGNAREYAHPGVYATGASVFELTWQVEGGSFTGTLRRIPGGEVVPLGGQAKGPDNPSTPANTTAGYNWGFVGPGAPAAVRACTPPCGGPVFPNPNALTNTIALTPDATFAIVVPGQSVYIQGIKQLPVTGDTWRIIIESMSDRGTFFEEPAGRDPDVFTGPFTYIDNNSTSAAHVDIAFERAIVNVYPGARWRLTINPGSLNPEDVELAAIRTVPNPYVANAPWDFSQTNQRLEFTNLPPVATIRLYTISGNLVRVLEHTNGSGTEVWDLRTRFNLKAASGHYYWTVTTPEGEQIMGLLSIIQNEIGAN